MNEQDYQKLKALITRHEGVRNRVYKCSAGCNTIGVGHNLDANPISERAIDVILEDDINGVVAQVSEFKWFPKLDPVRQAAVLDMVFNMGIGTFKQFRNTIRLIENGKYEEAGANAMNSLWAKQVGKRANRITKMIRTGEWPE